MLENKNILLGIAGSIAAYKGASIARELVKHGADVRVCLTKSGAEFITAATFRSLTGNPVITNMFDVPSGHDIAHISWARWADLFLIAPATANIIGKAANGIADDYLSTTIMSCEAPVLFAPAMNTSMYENPIFKENVRKLIEYGYKFIVPESGFLACGESGTGRLADLNHIMDGVVYSLTSNKPLNGKKILVSAGATREYIDPARFISNPSTGKMGYELAKQLKAYGGEITLISGYSQLPVPYDVEFIKVVSANDMYQAVMKHSVESDIICMVSAVSDWTPTNPSTTKMHKNNFDGKLEMKRTKDILYELGQQKGNRFLVGFGLETDDVRKNAINKLNNKTK